MQAMANAVLLTQVKIKKKLFDNDILCELLLAQYLWALALGRCLQARVTLFFFQGYYFSHHCLLLLSVPFILVCCLQQP